MNFKNENNNNENMNNEVELNNNKGELKMNDKNKEIVQAMINRVIVDNVNKNKHIDKDNNGFINNTKIDYSTITQYTTNKKIVHETIEALIKHGFTITNYHKIETIQTNNKKHTKEELKTLKEYADKINKKEEKGHKTDTSSILGTVKNGRTINTDLKRNDNIEVKINRQVIKEPDKINKFKIESLQDIEFKKFNSKQIKALKTLKPHRLPTDKREEFLTAHKVLEGLKVIKDWEKKQKREVNDIGLLLGESNLKINITDLQQIAPRIYKKIAELKGTYIFSNWESFLNTLEEPYLNNQIELIKTNKNLTENQKLNSIKYYKELIKEIESLKNNGVELNRWFLWDIFRYNRAIEVISYIKEEEAEKFLNVLSSLRIILRFKPDFIKRLKKLHYGN